MTTPTYIPTPETDALASRIVPLSRSQRMRAYRKLCLSLETRFTDTFAKNERLVMALKYYAAAPWASEPGVWHDKNYAEIACAALSSESPTLTLTEEVERLTHELENVWKPAAALNEQYARAYQDRLTAEKSLREAAEKERDRLLENMKDFGSLKSMFNAAQIRLDENDNEIVALRADRDKAVAEISELKMDVNDRMEERDRALDAKEKAVAELDDIKSKISGLRTYHKWAKADIEAKAVTIQKLSAKLDGLWKELEETRSKAQGLFEERKATSLEFDSVCDLARNRQEEVLTLRSQLSSIQSICATAHGIDTSDKTAVQCVEELERNLAAQLAEAVSNKKYRWETARESQKAYEAEYAKRKEAETKLAEASAQVNTTTQINESVTAINNELSKQLAEALRAVEEM